MPETLISIVIPVFNRSDLIGQTLDSLLAQTDVRWEARLVDDGSTDDSMGVIQRYADRDARFVVKQRTRSEKGASVCRNEGLSESRGRYVVFLDSDDLLAPHAVAQRIEALQARPGLDLLISQTRLFHDTPGDRDTYWNAYSDEPDTQRFFLGDPVWGTAAGTWRRGFIESLGGFNEHATIWQDWELHCRALMRQPRYDKLEQADVWYRQDRTHSQFRKGYETSAYWLRVAATVHDVLKDCESLPDTMPVWREQLLSTYLRQLHAVSATGGLREAWSRWRALRLAGKLSGRVYCRGVILLLAVSCGRGQGAAIRQVVKSLPWYMNHAGRNLREQATCPRVDLECR